MVKTIGHGHANFEDIIRIIFYGEEAKTDQALFKKAASGAVLPATPEEIDSILGQFKQGARSLVYAGESQRPRAILFTLLVFLIQRRELFTVDQITELAALLNSFGSAQSSLKFDCNNPATLIKSLDAVIGTKLSVAQVTALADNIEGIFQVAEALESYLSSELLVSFFIVSLAVYLDANNSDLKFIDAAKGWRSGNRINSDILTKLENFLFGHQSTIKTKTTSAIELDMVLFIQNFCNGLDQVKQDLKEFFIIDHNHSASTFFSETGASRTWIRNLKLRLQNMGDLVACADTKNTLAGLIKSLSVQGVSVADQEKVDAWLGSLRFISTSSSECLPGLVDAHNQNITILKESFEYITSLGACLIKKRECEELANPENVKQKLSFKVSSGTKKLLESDQFLKQAVHIPDGDWKRLQWKKIPIFFVQLKDTVAEFMESRNAERRRPKVPKGVKDTDPAEARVKTLAFNLIKNIYKYHGAVEIDTPVFELKETLLGKYGEEGSKLIYDLADQGGELLSLRYDLTVPFARYLATNNLKKLKRFHIGKVYRRDQPDINKGRFREFYQCDFDIAGPSDAMLPDAECLTIMHEVMTAVDVGSFEIKLGHRVMLEGIVALSGAPEKKFKTICSAIDKLDKEPWANVAEELKDKGLEPEMIEKIGKFVLHKGKIDDVLAELREKKLFEGHERALQALDEVELVSKYLKSMGSYDSIVLDLSLARGLDYYTGLIFEIVVTGANVGSVGGGGRYDKLVGMFGSTEIPCVGFSIGIERIFVLLAEKLKKLNQDSRQNDTEFFVATIGDGLVEQKVELIGELWKAGLKAEMLYEKAPKPKKQLTFANENKIPFVLWIGENEIKSSIVKIKVKSP
jgi:histidyl-tRNA synthetase